MFLLLNLNCDEADNRFMQIYFAIKLSFSVYKYFSHLLVYRGVTFRLKFLIG